MADGIDFPPRQLPFPDLDYGGMDTGGAPHGSTCNGWPYDLIDDVEVSPWNPPTTNRARGGSVHYAGSRPGAGGSPPDIDRGFYYTTDATEVITQAFWGQNSDYYFQTLVKSTEASIWAYADQGKYNFKVLADNQKARLDLWDDTKKNYVIVSTQDFPANSNPAQLTVQLREIDICEKDANGNSKKILVLCSEPYTT